MNTINATTGFMPFQLQLGWSPHLISPLIPPHPSSSQEDISACEIIQKLQNNILEAQDNLLHAKISQSVEANKHCSLTFPFVIGSCIWLTTLHQHNKYKVKGKKRVAKFMPCYNGPYTIVDTDKHHSTVTLELLNAPNIFPTFHTSEVLPFIKNNPVLFPSQKFEEPPLILTPEGDEEFFIDKILDQHRWGCSYQYLVCWCRYGHEHDQWLPHSELQDCSALDNWLATRGE